MTALNLVYTQLHIKGKAGPLTRTLVQNEIFHLKLIGFYVYVKFIELCSESVDTIFKPSE